MGRLISTYKTNKSIRIKIDNILCEMARIYANHGTNSKYDVGSNKSKCINEMKQKIKSLCPIFYTSLYPYKND